ncbi:TetR/AcrR family transcriptional regulator [soil metagenome]|nr:transcriptional regulator, TetR family [Rhodococcus erythropolis SK121]
MQGDFTVPRRPDPTRRRAEIAEALVRAANRDGLHAVTMRSVAAEAGVSLRLVQYYFTSKEELLVGALQHLEQSSQERWAQRLADLPSPPPPRSIIDAFAAEALPTDEPSSMFHLVWMSYAVLAMTNTQVARHPSISGIDRLERQLTEALQRAADADELVDCDAAIEAARLVALVNGLGTSILVGQRSIDRATEVITYHLDRLFAVPPATITEPAT